MTKRILVLLGFLFLRLHALGQSLSGLIKDEAGHAIQGANIYLLNTNQSTATNSNGKFQLGPLPEGTYEIKITALGFATAFKAIDKSSFSGMLVFSLIKDDKQLGEVLVTAQKRDDRAQILPLSISSLSSKQVEEDRIWNIKDITAFVPNLYASNPGDNRNVTSIRGVTTTSYDPAVATYIDGVNQFGLDTYMSQLIDVERVEVLSGPQGTLYGRNATGGVINIITKEPSNQISGFAGIDIGNYNLQRYSLGLRLPLIKDKLYLGAAGLFSSFGGFYTNSFTNTRFDKQHYFLGNYFLKFLANSRLAFTLNIKNNANRNNGPFALASSPAQALQTPFVIDQNATTTMVDNTFDASLSANYTGRSLNFTSQSSYQRNYRYYKQPIDGDFSQIDGVSIINNYGHSWNTVQTGIQEFRFSSPAQSFSHFKWTAGVYGFYNYSPTKQATHFGNDAALLGSPISNFSSININTSNNYGVAVFGQATYVFNPQFDLTAGIRYDHEHKKELINGAFQMDGQPAMTTRSDTSSKANFDAISPKLSAAWHLTDDNTVYATYNRGFRAGGISQLGSDPTQPPLYDYKPEYSNNYEVGTKNTFASKRLRLNAAFFYTLVNDAQVPTLVLPDAITITRNAGKLRSYGAELTFASRPVKGLELDYNFGYTHARYTNLNTPVNDSTVNLNGNRQVFTPDFTSMLIAQYGYGIGSQEKTRLIVHGEWRYLGEQFFDLANTIEQKGYSTFNLRLGVATKWLDVFLSESNIFNKHYIDYAYDFGASHLGNPRTYGLSVKARF